MNKHFVCGVPGLRNGRVQFGPHSQEFIEHWQTYREVRRYDVDDGFERVQGGLSIPMHSSEYMGTWESCKEQRINNTGSRRLEGNGIVEKVSGSIIRLEEGMSKIKLDPQKKIDTRSTNQNWFRSWFTGSSISEESVDTSQVQEAVNESGNEGVETSESAMTDKGVGRDARTEQKAKKEQADAQMPSCSSSLKQIRSSDNQECVEDSGPLARKMQSGDYVMSRRNDAGKETGNEMVEASEINHKKTERDSGTEKSAMAKVEQAGAQVPSCSSSLKQICSTDSKEHVEDCEPPSTKKIPSGDHFRTRVDSKPKSSSRSKDRVHLNKNPLVIPLHVTVLPGKCGKSTKNRGNKGKRSLKTKTDTKYHGYCNKDNPKPFQSSPCVFCLKKFHQKNKLNKHLFSHIGERPFMCRKCPKTFSSNQGLKIHMATHQAKGTKVFTSPKCHKRFRCTLCIKSFSLDKDLRRHHNSSVHSDKRPYECPTCGKACNRKDNFRRHLRTQHGLSKEEANQLATEAEARLNE